MKLLGIGTAVVASGHAGTVEDIQSIVNLDTGGRMPVLFIKLHDSNRMVSLTGYQVEANLSSLLG